MPYDFSIHPDVRNPALGPHPDDVRFQQTYRIHTTRVRRNANNIHPQSAKVPVGHEGVVAWKNLRTHMPVVQWDNGMRCEHHFEDIDVIPTPVHG